MGLEHELGPEHRLGFDSFYAKPFFLLVSLSNWLNNNSMPSVFVELKVEGHTKEPPTWI